MAKGFSYQWNPTKASADQAAWSKVVIENFRQLQAFINGYIPTFESDSQDLILPADVGVIGNLTVFGTLKHGDGKQHIHVYDSVGSQSISNGVWTKIGLDAELGSHSSDTFTHDAANDLVTITEPGVYIATGQVTFQAAESGYLRIQSDGVNELARAKFTLGLEDQVVALFSSIADADITFEVFLDNPGDTTNSPGSVATYMGIAKLEGVTA